MCNKKDLEQTKRIMQRNCFLIAKGITRGEMCYVLDTIFKKYDDERKIPILIRKKDKQQCINK